MILASFFSQKKHHLFASTASWMSGLPLSLLVFHADVSLFWCWSLHVMFWNFRFWLRKISWFLGNPRVSWVHTVQPTRLAGFHPPAPRSPRHFRGGQGGCCLQRPTLGPRVKQVWHMSHQRYQLIQILYNIMYIYIYWLYIYTYI